MLAVLAHRLSRGPSSGSLNRFVEPQCFGAFGVAVAPLSNRFKSPKQTEGNRNCGSFALARPEVTPKLIPPGMKVTLAETRRLSGQARARSEESAQKPASASSRLTDGHLTVMLALRCLTGLDHLLRAPLAMRAFYWFLRYYLISTHRLADRWGYLLSGFGEEGYFA